jgi:tRNA threonylcarbamoyladenosine biosynthesis protein TsaB
LITLGIDTCEARGSVAVRREGTTVSLQRHESAEDYSSWLIPAVERGMLAAQSSIAKVDLMAVATGPGSFTGVRVGLTAVKAWAELFGKRVVGVSRLEVMARGAGDQAGFVAASFDAQRGQVFGGLYRCDESGGWSLMEAEMVISPDEFVNRVSQHAKGAMVRWITMDSELFTGGSHCKERAGKGESLIRCAGGLAAGVAQLGEERASKGQFTDALLLDANYVRRSDAEIFWKDPAAHEK